MVHFLILIKKKTFKEEYLEFLKRFEVAYDEKYLFEWYDWLFIYIPSVTPSGLEILNWFFYNHYTPLGFGDISTFFL